MSLKPHRTSRRRLFWLSLLGILPASRRAHTRDLFESRAPAGDANDSNLVAQSTTVPVQPQLSLPFQGAATSNGKVFAVRNLSGGDYEAAAIAGYGPTGVYGESGRPIGFGVMGVGSGGLRCAGVAGLGSKGSKGVTGQSDTDVGVQGASGYLGVKGVTSGGSAGVSGEFREGKETSDAWKTVGYLGRALYGVHGISDIEASGSLKAGGFGVYGVAKGGIGVVGDSITRFGILGQSEKEIGVVGRSSAEAGVQGESTESRHDGVNGFGLNGVRGVSFTPGGGGVVGVFRKGAEKSGTTNTDALAGGDGITRGWIGTEKNGVIGESDVEGGFGVAGKSTGGENGVGIYGQAAGGNFAGFFRGRVTITDHLIVKTLFVETITAAKSLLGGAAGKFFKIDHPLDPANQFLYHASIESNELKNLYDGVVTLDASGRATVVLPGWFEALNTDFRYQLTCIGAHASVFIAKEIAGGQFEIAGGQRGMKVSWQVTGTRKDVYARAHPMQAEQVKTPDERGKYLHPIELGFPETQGIHYQDTARVPALD